jgi:hypothetical protein
MEVRKREKKKGGREGRKNMLNCHNNLKLNDRNE